MPAPHVYKEATLATMQPEAGDYGLIPNAALVTAGGKIAWLGPMADLPKPYASVSSTNLAGRLITPALIDCHTHIVHGGNRALEFEMRLQGARYEDIACAGGGIVSTVTATRDASEADLLKAALIRVDALIAEGVSTIEVKSGYGLDIDTELKMLRTARQIAMHRPVRVLTSFLGAHAVPKGANADTYIDDACIPALKAAHA